QAHRQLFLAAEMPVQRHRSDAELAREPPDRQRVGPARVGERERPLDHGLLAQPRPLGVFANLCALHDLTTIHRTREAVLRTCTTYKNDVQEFRTGQGTDSAKERPVWPDAGGRWWPWG